MGKIAVTPLTTTVGAELSGIDLGKPIAEDAVAQIRQALWDHGVIVFRDQHIGLEEQKAAVSVFGVVEAVKPHRMAGDDDPATVIQAEVWTKSAGAVPPLPTSVGFGQEWPGWHVDSCFCEEIPRVACLRPEVISPVGGSTSWASMPSAFDALSPKMQSWLETLDVVYAPPPGYARFLGVENLAPDLRKAWEEEFRPRLHPLVARHPDSGRKLLYVNPSYVVAIDGLAHSESAALLRFLYNHCFQAQFVYRHMWRDGDIVMWDELATTHLAPTDYLPHPRRLVRVFAGTVRPVPARDFAAEVRQPEFAA